MWTLTCSNIQIHVVYQVLFAQKRKGHLCLGNQGKLHAEEKKISLLQIQAQMSTGDSMWNRRNDTSKVMQVLDEPYIKQPSHTEAHTQAERQTHLHSHQIHSVSLSCFVLSHVYYHLIYTYSCDYLLFPGQATQQQDLCFIHFCILSTKPGTL